MIHLLSAIGLTPGGSSTVHIYTQTIHRTTQLTTFTQLTTRYQSDDYPMGLKHVAE
jgi:uncharacterized integral membrane protein